MNGFGMSQWSDPPTRPADKGDTGANTCWPIRYARTIIVSSAIGLQVTHPAEQSPVGSVEEKQEE